MYKRQGDTLSLATGNGQGDYKVVGSFKSRATDVEAVIPSTFAVSDFGASAYDFLAYTAADPDAILSLIHISLTRISRFSLTGFSKSL